MPTPLSEKSTTSQIQARFDADVERFANLQTGQSATMDAPLVLELLTQSAVAATRPIWRVLDIGCGAGNNSLKLRQVYGQDFDCDLLDLSQPMLDRAQERLQAACPQGKISTVQADFRTADLPAETYDVILAAAVLHHLRDDQDWEAAFAKLFQLTAPGGSVWVSDLVAQETDAIHQIVWQRYGDYLTALKNEAYRDQVFAYIDQEDSPRPATYQMELLRKVGFAQVELLHKNACFAAFGAVKAR